MGDFETDTQVEGADGRYTAEVSPEWQAWGPNGGYMASIAMRAAGAEAAIPRPVAFAAHFLRYARFEAVELAVQVVHRGRSSESISVSMTQQGRPILEGMLRTAAELPGLDHDVTEPPDVPGPEGLPTLAELRKDDWPFYPFWRNLESRPTDFRPELERSVPRAPRARGWQRFVPRASFDDPFVDAGRVLVLMDTMIWPAATQAHPDSGYLAPNLDVVAWFHRSSRDSEWLLNDAFTPIGAGGLLGGQQRIWSQERKLLASGGAQLLCVPQD